MQEDFIQYLWQYRKFDTSNLLTTAGEKLQITHSGTHNSLAGPDFLNARIQVGTIQLVGNVELHVKASDFLKHQHEKDSQYHHLILHVVWENDCSIAFLEKRGTPTLELKNRVPTSTHAVYKQILASKNWIPCQNLVENVPQSTRQFWLERLVVERLEHKTERIKQRLQFNKNDMEQTFYEFLSRYFGVANNKENFEKLGRQLPFTLLKKQSELIGIESLLFGQAGFLNESVSEDDYFVDLKNTYQHLRHKYQLPEALDAESWHFFGSHPANFPTVRLAQIAVVLFKNPNFFQACLLIKNPKELKAIFDFETSTYWKTHYHFKKESPARTKRIGRKFLEQLCINVVVPFQFAYSQLVNNREGMDAAIELLNLIPAEQNHIVRRFRAMHFGLPSAAQSQAVLQLKQDYCDAKKCLQCAIGHKILHSKAIHS